MAFANDEKHLAMALAYTTLVTALLEKGALDAELFAASARVVIEETAQQGHAGAAAALEELLSNLVDLGPQPDR